MRNIYLSDVVSLALLALLCGVFGCKTSEYQKVKVQRPVSKIIQRSATSPSDQILARYSSDAIAKRSIDISPPQAPPQTPLHVYQHADVSRGVAHIAPVNNRNTMEAPVFHALLIGVNRYRHPNIMDLDKPINDMRRLKDVLTAQYLFEDQNIVQVENPDRMAIFTAFSNLRKRVSENDSLLIFYAGHGKWLEDRQQGYWLPSDAIPDHTASWISNSDIQDEIRSFKNRKTFLIADACFSGALIKSRGVADVNRDFQERYQNKSRVAMTSIEEGEVPDKSVFIDFLINALKKNKQTYLDSQKLFVDLYNPVYANSPVRQAPMYGIIPKTGHEKGAFIFVRK